MDFTDTTHPFENAYFDRGPIDAKPLVLGGDWSAYWYNGTIYGSEIARVLDVFELTPTKFLTQNEIDAAKAVHMAKLNVQDQQKVEWPSQLIVVRAYLDQLARSQALSTGQTAYNQKAIGRAAKSHMDTKDLANLNSMAAAIEDNASKATNPADSVWLHALSNILEHPVA